MGHVNPNGDQLRVVVASRNPVKLGAADRGFSQTFPDRVVEILAADASSGVADQPCSDVETLAGATNRVAGVRAAQPNADYWVGIEGGLSDVGGVMEAFAWVVVASPAGSGRSRTASFLLPPAVARLVRSGLELGDADDQVFGRTNSKQNQGAVGLLTDGVIDRQELYEPAVILALAPVAKPGLYELGIDGESGSAGSVPTGPRPAREDELGRLREIERSAGVAFVGIGMGEVAADDPPSVETLARYQRDGRAWVQIDDDDRAIGYLIADLVDGMVHIEQVSVDPSAAGRGLGRGLIDHVMAWAAARGCAAVTLTTFAEVAWNAPYYERLGFRVLPADELGPGLRQIRADEAEHGLDRWPRVAMIREVDTP